MRRSSPDRRRHHHQFVRLRLGHGHDPPTVLRLRSRSARYSCRYGAALAQLCAKECPPRRWCFDLQPSSRHLRIPSRQHRPWHGVEVCFACNVGCCPHQHLVVPDTFSQGRRKPMTGLKQALCWFAVLLLPFLGVWMFHLSAYHFWATVGPPNRNADWHGQWSSVFFRGRRGCPDRQFWVSSHHSSPPQALEKSVTTQRRGSCGPLTIWLAAFTALQNETLLSHAGRNS